MKLLRGIANGLLMVASFYILILFVIFLFVSII
jgi:hypothetical protein